MVCTHSTLRPPSALREAGKAFGLSEVRIKELSAFAPRWWPGVTREKLEAARSRLVQQARDANEQAALQMALELERTPHHQSIHPGGIVIAPGAITDFVPLQHSTKGLRVTQFDSSAIEKLGLVKIDLLGISALTVMADCAELVRARVPNFELASIPSDDPATAETLVAAQTVGCFQIESPGMRLTLREVSARSASDLIVALALYRPGPLKGGLKRCICAPPFAAGGRYLPTPCARTGARRIVRRGVVPGASLAHRARGGRFHAGRSRPAAPRNGQGALCTGDGTP